MDQVMILSYERFEVSMNHKFWTETQFLKTELDCFEYSEKCD